MGDAPTNGIVFAAYDVARVVLQFSNGTSASFRAVEVAGSRVLAYAIPAHVRVTDSRELGMRGQVVGSTRGQALGSQRTPGWSC